MTRCAASPAVQGRLRGPHGGPLLWTAYPAVASMQRLQAFKNELMPTGAQQRQMRPCRFVFNQALALQKERYEHEEKKLSCARLCKLLTEQLNGTQTPWLKGAPPRGNRRSRGVGGNHTGWPHSGERFGRSDRARSSNWTGFLPH